MTTPITNHTASSTSNHIIEESSTSAQRPVQRDSISFPIEEQENHCSHFFHFLSQGCVFFIQTFIINTLSILYNMIFHCDFPHPCKGYAPPRLLKGGCDLDREINQKVRELYQIVFQNAEVKLQAHGFAWGVHSLQNDFFLNPVISQHEDAQRDFEWDRQLYQIEIPAGASAIDIEEYRQLTAKKTELLELLHQRANEPIYSFAIWW